MLNSLCICRCFNCETDNFRTAALIGCTLAIERNYFFEMGAFDEGMDVWGGENIELPVRVRYSSVVRERSVFM